MITADAPDSSGRGCLQEISPPGVRLAGGRLSYPADYSAHGWGLPGIRPMDRPQTLTISNIQKNAAVDLPENLKNLI